MSNRQTTIFPPFELRSGTSYDIIILGAGAAGLMAAANLPLGKASGLLIDHREQVGRKLLMSGHGRCNITHAGSVKDFPSRYGEASKFVRRLLYRYSNEHLLDFLRASGVETITEEDGRIFPKTLKAETVLQTLLEKSRANGFDLAAGTEVTAIRRSEKGYKITVSARGKSATLRAALLLVTCGGLSYPSSGSDGSLHRILACDLGLPFTPLRPSLYPLAVADYPYGDLAGLSLSRVTLSLYPKEGKRLAQVEGPLLFAHQSFTGPAMLNLSRFAVSDGILEIRYLEDELSAVQGRLAAAASRNPKAGLPRLIREEFGLPQRLAQAVGLRASGSPKRAARMLTADRFPVHVPPALILTGSDSEGSSTAPPNSPLPPLPHLHPETRAALNRAMVTAGGVSREAVNRETLEAVSCPGLYLAGEILDVDGETGGYNLQFAWSSACAAAAAIREHLR